MPISFPRTAVIRPDSLEEAEILLHFLDEYEFRLDGDQKITDKTIREIWSRDTNTCFDIETERKNICWCNESYYREEFEDDYPELMPDENMFMCSVNDFIVFCGGENRFKDFEGVDTDELKAFLFS